MKRAGARERCGRLLLIAVMAIVGVVAPAAYPAWAEDGAKEGNRNPWRSPPSGDGSGSQSGGTPARRPWGQPPPVEPKSGQGVDSARKSYSQYLWEREYYQRYGRFPESNERRDWEQRESPERPPPTVQEPPGEGWNNSWERGSHDRRRPAYPALQDPRDAFPPEGRGETGWRDNWRSSPPDYRDYPHDGPDPQIERMRSYYEREFWPPYGEAPLPADPWRRPYDPGHWYDWPR